MLISLYSFFLHLYMCLFFFYLYCLTSFPKSLPFYFSLRTFSRICLLSIILLFFTSIIIFIFTSIFLLFFLRLLYCSFSNLLNWTLNYFHSPFVFQWTEAIFSSFFFFQERSLGIMFFKYLYVLNHLHVAFILELYFGWK